MINNQPKVPTTILIAEDDPMMQLGIKKMIESHTELKIVAIVNNGQEAIKKTFELQPDIVLIDLGLPLLDGIEATRQIKTSLPNIKVMILTCQTDKEQVLTAFAGGADAYCIKGLKIQQLTTAFTLINEGSVYLDPKIAEYLLHPEQSTSGRTFDLTSMEIQILTLTAEGKNNKEISDRLSISHNQVKNHLQNIFTKLSVSNRVQAALKAYQLRLIKPTL